MRLAGGTRSSIALGLALTLAVLAAPAATAGKGALKRRRKAPPAPEVVLPATVAGGVGVTMPPIGLSIEYPVLAADLGAGSCPPPALVAELARLGSPPIELAGVTQDMTAPTGALQGVPATSWEAATLYSLPAGFWSQLHCLLAATREHLTVGLNLRTGQSAWAAQMVSEATAAAVAGVDFSLGNEPDLYGLPNLSSLDKPALGEEALAASLYVRLASALEQSLGPIPVIGPELSRPAAWQPQLPNVIRQLHVQTVGVHMYPLTTCATPRAVTLKGLLSEGVGSAPRRLAWVVADASLAGLPAVISEANSASCGGKAGVSDSPASAVWAVRFVLAALKTGFREVRFHFSGDPYDPFSLRAGALVANPLENALYVLARWLPVGSSLRTVNVVRGLSATLIGSPTGAPTLVLDNERPVHQQVTLRTARTVTLQLLRSDGAGLVTVTERPTHDRLALSLAPESILAAASSP